MITITNIMTNTESRDFVFIFSGKSLISNLIMVNCSEFTKLIMRFHLLLATQIFSWRARCHKTLYPFIGLSVHRSVNRSVNNNFNKARVSREESNVIMSSYSHLIIMRTHRWPRGPCSVEISSLSRNFDSQYSVLRINPLARENFEWRVNFYAK